MSHVHYEIEAMNDEGDWETPLPAHMNLADALDAARDIAEDYPRGVRVNRVIVESERVWTNQPSGAEQRGGAT